MVSLIHYRFRYTMRNESNKYEKQDKIRAFLQRNYEKYRLKKSFLIIYSIGFLLFTPKE